MAVGIGFKIYGAVIDGMRGLAKALWPIPVQLCQFHQILTVRHYLTQDPDLDASRELLCLVNNITRMDKESFGGAFNEWYEQNNETVNEWYMTNASERKHHHTCAQDYAANILA